MTGSRGPALPPDTRGVLELLDALDGHPHPAVRAALPRSGEVVVARAPGRLDVMGGIADYSGSLVLQYPIREAAHAAVELVDEPVVSVVSLARGGAEGVLAFEMPLDDVAALARAGGYAEARDYFRRDEASAWAAYVAGAFVALARERGLSFGRGARLLLVSDVPMGKGVSSSAAVEVASMHAVAAAHGVALAPRDLALLCQKVENLVVGAPCGVMDQMTAACGEQGRMLALRCQPAELEGAVEVPRDLELWGLDSGVRHAVAGEDYGSVRTAAFMGYRVLADLAGLEASPLPDGTSRVDDPRWRGYLANVAPDEFAERYAGRLPERMRGDEFLARYGGTIDPVTRVSPEKVYPVLAATAHPVYESARVEAFRRLLAEPEASGRGEALGALMYESHASYSSCGLGSEATDLLVALVREAGPGRGLFGAKITGGGSGGTVAVLGRRGAAGAVAEAAAEFERRAGYAPHLFSGSSPGAYAVGHVRYRRAGE